MSDGGLYLSDLSLPSMAQNRSSVLPTCSSLLRDFHESLKPLIVILEYPATLSHGGGDTCSVACWRLMAPGRCFLGLPIPTSLLQVHEKSRTMVG